MVQLSASRCSCIAILWVNLVSFATITICIYSQWVLFISLLTQSGNFWIYPCIYIYNKEILPQICSCKCWYNTQTFSFVSYFNLISYQGRMYEMTWICTLQSSEANQYAAAHTMSFLVCGSTVLYACVGIVVFSNAHNPLLPWDLQWSVHSAVLKIQCRVVHSDCDWLCWETCPQWRQCDILGKSLLPAIWKYF